ncbi:MAG: transcription termination/antitermination NusG family protein [Kiritimatiellales bacterium]
MNKEASAQADTVWICVKTQTRREHIAAGQLRRLAEVEVFCPRIRFRRNTRRGRVWFDEALFPGYLFVRCKIQTTGRIIATTAGVRGIIRFAGEYATVPAPVIEFLKREGGETVIIREPELRTGDEVIVAAGALRGLRAVITQELPGSERVNILMDLMGTAVAAEVPVDVLERVA